MLLNMLEVVKHRPTTITELANFQRLLANVAIHETICPTSNFKLKLDGHGFEPFDVGG